MKKYEQLDREDLAPNLGLKLLEDRFNGIIVTVDKVSFEEEGTQCRMRFGYEVIDDNGKEYDKKDLEREIGDIIIEAIENGLQENSLIYSGGTDGENREDNFIQPNPQ